MIAEDCAIARIDRIAIHRYTVSDAPPAAASIAANTSSVSIAQAMGILTASFRSAGYGIVCYHTGLEI